MRADQRLELALVCAKEYRTLLAQGRYPEADQVQRTIDGLVGGFTHDGKWVTPVELRRIQGLA